MTVRLHRFSLNHSQFTIRRSVKTKLLCARIYRDSVRQTTYSKLGDIKNLEFYLELHIYSLIENYTRLSGIYATNISNIPLG